MNTNRTLLSCLLLAVLLSNASLSRQNTTTFAGFQLTYSTQTPIQPYLTIPLGTPSKVNVSVTFAADGTVSTGRIEDPFSYASGGLAFTIKSGTFDVQGGVLSLNGTVSYGTVFTVTFTDLRLNAGGIVSMGTLNAAGETISAYGFQLLNPTLTILQGTGVCTVNATIALPNSIGTIGATAQFSNQGLLLGVSLHDWSVNPTYSGFALADTKTILAADGLTMAGNISLPSGAGKIPYTDFKIGPNGIVQPPQFTLANQQLTISGYTFKLTSAQFQNNRLDVSGDVDLGGGNRITVGRLSFNSNGSITAENLAFAGTLAVGGLTVTSGNLSYTGNAFLIDIAVTLPSLNGTVKVNGVKIGSDGSLSAGTVVVQGVTLTYQSLTATLISCSIDFKSGKATLTSMFSVDKFGSLELDGVVVSSSGIVDYGSFKIEAARTYTVGSYAVMIQSIDKLGTNGLAVKAKLSVSGLAEGLSMILNITSQGVSVQSITVTNVSATINGFTATLSKASLGIDDTLRLDGTLALGTYGSATFTNLTMTTGGRVCGANITVTPGSSFTVGDMALSVKRLAFNGQALSLDGTVGLAGGGIITITNANLKSSLSFTDGTITASGPITVGGFNIMLTSGTLSASGLSINGTVSLQGATGTMSVEGVRLTRTGATSIEKINLNNVQSKMGDFKLTLDSAGFSQGKVIAAGTAVLPAPYGTLRVTNLQINSNGTVTGGQFVLSGASATYGGVTLSLTSATFANNTISISGGFNLEKQGLRGTVSGLVLTPGGVQSTGVITLAQKTVTVNGYSFTISSCTLAGNKISIDGSMKAGALTVNAKGLTLSTMGIFSGGALSIDPSTPLKISGMTVTVTKLDLESDHIEFDGSVTIANGGTISLRSLNVKPDGSFVNGTITYGGTPLSFAGGTLQTATMTITDKGFRTDGKFTLPGNLATVGAYGIVVSGSGVTGIDSVSLAGVSLTYNGFTVTPTAMRFPSTGISIDGTVSIPSFGQLIITGLTLGINGSFQGGTISASQSAWTWKGYTIQVTTASITTKGVSIDGTIAIPDHGTATITNLIVDSRGIIAGGTLTTRNLTFTAGGFTVSVTGGSLNNDGVSFSGTITLPNSWGTVGVSDLRLTTTGSVLSATLSYNGSGPSLGGFTVVVSSMKLNTAGLAVSGSLTLPASVTGKVLVDNFILSPQGLFAVGSVTVQNVSAKCGNFTATLDSARYANKEFSFSGTIPLPGQYGKVSVVDLTLNTSGSLERGTLMLQGSTITHNGFVVTNLTGSFVSGNVVLGGSVVLPNGLGTATLSGLTLSGATVVSYGSVALAGSKTITWQSYAVTVDSMLISQGLISINGSLAISGVGTVKAKNLCISPQGKFSGGTIVLEPNTSWTYNGFVIAVTSAEIQQMEVEIGGTITIPNLNKSLTLANVNFSADGIPNGGTITYNGPPFAYKGYQLALSSVAFAKGGIAGTATFAFGTSSGSATITISNAGAVNVTDFAVKNVNLTYGGFAINNVSVQMAGDSVEYSGSLTVPQVGTFTVRNMIVSTSGTVVDPGTVTFSARTFSYSSYMITVDSVQFHTGSLGLTGSIQLPANKGIVHVADLLLSTTGKLSGGIISTTGVTISHAGYTLMPQTIRWEGDGIEMDATFTIPQAQGVFAVKSFEIGLTGKVNLASISYSGPDITFGGFTLSKVTIHTADLTDLSVDGTVQLPPSVGGMAIVSGLRFMTGDVSVQKIVLQNASMKYNSFSVTVDSITYANKLMVVNGKLGLPDPYGTLGVVGLAFDFQGNIQGGTITAQNVKMTYKGFVLTLSNVSMGTDGILTLNGSVTLPNTNGTMTLTGFRMDGTHVVDMGNAVFTGSTITWQAYIVQVDTVKLLDRALLFDGSVKIGSSTSVRGQNLEVGINGEFLGGSIDIKGLDSVKVGGFVVNLSNVQVSATGLTATGSITFPNNYGKLTATTVSISADGKFSDGPWIYTPAAPITYNGATLTIQSVMLKSGTLSATASLLLPNKLTTVTANEVTISYPWNISVGSITVANASFTYNGYTFTLNSATYSGSDLVINGTVDASNLGKATFTGVKISTSGQFSGGTVAYSNSWKWGSLDVTVTKASYDWEGKIVTISGSVALPGVGNASVDSLIINTVTGAISNANVRASGTYTYGGRTFAATVTYANNEIELDGKIDLSQTSYVSVAGLDISVADGSISGGTFQYVGPGLTFGGATVTINSVIPTLKSITVTATVDLPGNLGTAVAKNATFDLDGSFKVDSVLFYGQSLNYNGFGVTVTHGVLTSKFLRIDVLAMVGGVSFGIDSLMFTGGRFSGGYLDFSMTKITYKGYTLKIHTALELPGGGYKVSADFALPESKGFGRINGINICTTGFDFSAAQIDWASLPNLLPTGFSFTITKAEFVDGGFDLTGTLSLSAFFNLNLDGLLVTPNRINLDSAHIQVGDLKVGPYQFAGLTFDFRSAHPTWLVHMNGTVKLPGNFEGFTLDGTVDGNQNFKASILAKTKDPILIGNTGTELVGAGGGLQKSGNDYALSLTGIFAPVGMQKTLNGNGTLVIDANGKISGILDVKLLDLIPMAKATMVIDIPTKIFTVTGKAGFHRILSYDGGMNIDAKPFKAKGNGNVEIDGIALAQSSLLMDEKVFSATGKLKIPDPASSLTLVEIDGTITVVPSSSVATMAGTLSLLGYSVSSGNLTVSDDSISASGQINLGVATGDFGFLATQTPPPPTPNTPNTPGVVVPDVAGFLRDHPEDAGSIDLAIDVIQAEYPDIYQELLKDQQDIANEEMSIGGVGRKFGPGTMPYKLAKLRAQSIAQHVTSIVDLAGLDPNEFQTSIQTWLLGHSIQPSFERAAWASQRPSLASTPELYASIATPSGGRFALPLSALTPLNDGGPRQIQTLDFTDAYRDVRISLPDWSPEPVYSCDQGFAGILEASESAPFDGFKLKTFTASVAIKFRGLTFDKTTVSIAGGTYQGTTKVTIPGVGSGTVTFTGSKTGITSFSGSFAVTIHGFTLSDASVNYTFNGSKATLNINGSTSFIGTTFGAASSVSETNGSFSVDSFTLRGSIGVHWTVEFGFKWKIFHVHFKKTLDLNFGSETFSYQNSSLKGNVGYKIDFPWPIHQQRIGFDVDITTNNVGLSFSLFGTHTLNIPY